jgi:hypothetical protein
VRLSATEILLCHLRRNLSQRAAKIDRRGGHFECGGTVAKFGNCFKASSGSMKASLLPNCRRIADELPDVTSILPVALEFVLNIFHQNTHAACQFSGPPMHSLRGGRTGDRIKRSWKLRRTPEELSLPLQ